MISKSIKVIFLALCVLFAATVTAYAEEFTNTIQSVKVKSSGDKAVVVDVYINSSDESVKPQLSSRKYKDDKYVIDLMQVTQQGNVSKDTSASSGLLKSKDIRVGKLPGGTARVLINLEDPDVEVKEVRYHTLSTKKAVVKTAVDKPVEKKVEPEKPVETAAKTPDKTITPDKEKSSKLTISKTPEKTAKTLNTEVKESKQPENKVTKVATATSKKPDNKSVSSPKPDEKKPVNIAKPEKPDVADKNNDKSTKETELSSETTKPASGPQIIHKTDTPVVTKTEEPKTTENKAKIALAKPVNTRIQEEKKDTKASEIQKEKKNDHNKIAEAHKEPEKIEKKSVDQNLIAQAVPDNVEHKTETEEVEEPLDPGQLPVNLTEDNPEKNLKVVDTKDKDVDFMGLLLTLIGALVIVIPLIYIAIWFINLFYKGGDSIGLKTLSSMGGNNFKIISSTSLGQGKSIHLVEIKGRQLVIGCTNNSINILTEFGDFDSFVEEQEGDNSSEKSSSIKKKFAKGRPPLGSFADLYKDYTSKIDEEDLEDEY